MELLYVWVEEYGNIRKQGFNFSPNYDFEVKKQENGEYILVDNFETSGKKKQPENFFGDNISNITAIVGKNGSGKSTLIEFVLNGQGYGFCLIEIEGVIHYKLNGSNIQNLQGIFKKLFCYMYKKIESIEENIVYCSELFNGRQDVENINAINVSFMKRFKNILDQYNEFSQEDRDRYSFENQYRGFNDRLLKSPKNKDKKTMIELDESELNMFKSVYEIVLGDKYNLPSMITLDSMKTQIEWISSLKLSEINLLNIIRIPKKVRIWLNFGQFPSSFEEKKNIENIMEERLEYERLGEIKYQNYVNDSKNKEEFLENELIYNLLYFFAYKGKISIFNKENTKSLGQIKENFQTYSEFNKIINLFIELKPLMKNYRMERGTSFYLDIKKNSVKILELLQWYKEILQESHIKEIKNLVQIEWEYNLSSGEITLLNLFLQIHKKKSDIKNGTIFILDEPDITLHPEWQRVTLDLLIKYINLNYKDSQIILTSHSPFIASDLPKENVIMLDTDKDGNCIVRNDKNIKTFGANIFDLYTDAFFVESSFGEFAKGKIKEVVKWLTYEEDEKTKERTYINEEKINKEQIEYILNSIGEPLVKNKLQKMYDEYRESKITDEKNKELLAKFKSLPLEKQLEIYKDYENKIGEK